VREAGAEPGSVGITVTWACREPEPGPFRDSLLAAAATVAKRWADAFDRAALAECYAACFPESKRPSD
jgi:hypothetical protein